MISRLPVSWQFLLLAFLSVVLTLSGIALSMQRSRDLAFVAKKMEIRNEAEEGASIIRHFVEMDSKGEMSRQEAQKRAIEAIQGDPFRGEQLRLPSQF